MASERLAPRPPITSGRWVAGGLFEKPDAVLHCAGFGVFGGEIDPPQPDMGDGAGAHSAGLKRNIEVASIEPAGPAIGERGADGQHFGMGGWGR
jgi:hypothetical protein